MTRLVLAIGVSALLLAAPLGALAGDTPAAAAQGKAASDTAGCMPGGGCCGGGSAAECPMAPKAASGKAAGGCPCQKAKQAAQQAPPAAKP